MPSTSTRTAAPPDWRPLTACCLATFLLLGYTTVVTVGTSSITTDLGASFAVSQWIIDVYTLALAALVLAMGSLGDRLGHKRLFLIGLAVFGVASGACAAAPTGSWLVTARAAQGVGGAAIFATTVPLLALRYDGRTRGTAFAVWGAVAGAGSTVGTVAGGAVTEFVSWRWLFVGGLPLCAIALAVGAAALPSERAARTRLDIPGASAVTVAMTAFTFTAINAGERGWAAPATVAAALVGIGATGAFVAVERHAPQPMLPPSLFATRSFSAVLLVGFGYYFGAFAALPVLSRWLQSAAGMSAVGAALVLAIQLAAFVPVSLLLSARLHAAPQAWVLGGGTLLTGCAGLTGAALWVRPDWTTLIAALVVTGIGAGIVSPVLPAVAATSVPPDRAGTASAAANAARQLGLTIGVALCGAHDVATAFTLCGAVAVACGTAATLLLRRHPT